MSGRTTSARSMVTSFVLHGLVLALLALVPTKVLDRSARPREVDVVFRRLMPRMAPAKPLPPPRDMTAGVRQEQAKPAALPVSPPRPVPSAPRQPIEEMPSIAQTERPARSAATSAAPARSIAGSMNAVPE